MFFPLTFNKYALIYVVDTRGDARRNESWAKKDGLISILVNISAKQKTVNRTKLQQPQQKFLKCAQIAGKNEKYFVQKDEILAVLSAFSYKFIARI